MRVFLLLIAMTLNLHAASGTFEIDLGGTGGPGLRGDNVVPPNSSPATGFELAPGLRFNWGLTADYATLNFGWGSMVGGVDLTGELLDVSIWGPASPTSTAPTQLYVVPTSSQTPDGRSGTVSTIFDISFGAGGYSNA